MNNYSQHREAIKSGDVILWKGTGAISRLIRLYGGYSHASLVIRLEEFKGLTDRRFILEANASGIELRILSWRVKKYDGEAWWLPLKKEYCGAREQIVTWALDQVGTPYDFGSVIKNIFGRVSADCTRYFCSEFVFLAYRAAGLVEGKTAPRPGDIAKWDVLNEPVRLK
ncbi:MAG: YiiX/YebB-like N1pC/P60 family cysteine hydrolase [Thermodesulfobacteriota bacterium]|jgi:uncharacterized protein YycO|nr:MAG: YiiX/YebB-like N1pC/P60 family cysteine hydrolase [Thermodesulfobacteriota bacterium]WAC08911.1 MAG: YiiX/YebB-like N1pC/P60 family cysteine hydrolase [Thermodesulfobacteriota bacterium]